MMIDDLDRVTRRAKDAGLMPAADWDAIGAVRAAFGLEPLPEGGGLGAMPDEPKPPDTGERMQPRTLQAISSEYESKLDTMDELIRNCAGNRVLVGELLSHLYYLHVVHSQTGGECLSEQDIQSLDGVIEHIGNIRTRIISKQKIDVSRVSARGHFGKPKPIAPSIDDFKPGVRIHRQSDGKQYTVQGVFIHQVNGNEAVGLQLEGVRGMVSIADCVLMR